ncbi:MAG TPA: hypothetical protein VGD56_00160 [Gemmatirosa sp.]
MIDSLLFLPDVDGLAADEASAADLALDLSPAPEPDDVARAQVAAALAATRDGHAHALAGAWRDAATAFERSAETRDALVAAGLAGPAVAARAWSDVATVRVLAGDLDDAHAARARVRSALRDGDDLPADLRGALAELDAVLGPVAADMPPTAAATPAADPGPAAITSGLLWLDTTDDVVAVVDDPPTIASPAPVTPAAPTAPTRIAAIDAAVALAHPAERDGAPGGLAARLRRLLRR